MGEHRTRIWVVSLLVLTALVWLAPAASAACHRFSLNVSPESASEGDSITVTVGRDGSVDDSSVLVTASSGTAEAGSDFEALDQRVEFTGSALEESVTFTVLADGEAESTESFTVGLSDPGGCAVNPNFSLADDVTVTIVDDASTSGPAEDGGGEATPEESVAPPQSPDAPPVTDDDAVDEPDEEDDDGGFPVGLLIAALVVLIGAGGFLAYKKKG